jgi:predicted component of type VI protein secretion system
MILELQHRRPDGDVDTYHLKPGRRYHLGRGSNCEVRILDLKLSRKHAAIEFLEGAWQLIDLCSTNGCRLDGETMVGTVPLKSGHQIEIGQTALVVQAIVPRDGSAAPAHASSGYQSDEFNPADGSPSSLALSIRPSAPRASEKAAKYASSETFTPDPLPASAKALPEACLLYTSDAADDM